MALGARREGYPSIPSAREGCPPASCSPVPCQSQHQTQNQTLPLPLACQAAPLIPHTSPRSKEHAFTATFFPFPVPVHPHNKLPCENSFQASQEMAGSLMGFENCSCFWLCLLKHINQQGFFGKHPVSTCPPQHSQGPAQQSSPNGP